MPAGIRAEGTAGKRLSDAGAGAGDSALISMAGSASAATPCSEIPTVYGIPPWGFHTGPFTGTSSFAKGHGNINLQANTVSGVICQQDRDGVIILGGMGELGVGRGQIELLAALFHADAPNDVAPSAYNQDDPSGGLPASPLAPRPEATGFRWAA